MKLLILILLLSLGCNNLYDIPEKEWRQYRAMKGQDLVILWVQSFFDIEYQQPDKDCSGTFKPFMNGFGAKLKTQTARF